MADVKNYHDVKNEALRFAQGDVIGRHSERSEESHFVRCSKEKNMTRHEEAITEILTSAKKITANRAMLASIFLSSGIILDESLRLVSLSNDAETCLKILVSNLSPLPMVKVAAQHILRGKGMRV